MFVFGCELGVGHDSILRDVIVSILKDFEDGAIDAVLFGCLGLEG